MCPQGEGEGRDNCPVSRGVEGRLNTEDTHRGSLGSEEGWQFEMVPDVDFALNRALDLCPGGPTVDTAYTQVLCSEATPFPLSLSSRENGSEF